MDLHAIKPRPNTGKPHKGKGHTVSPYLLRNMKITRPNQAWGIDICYVPVGGGYMYLGAIIDLFCHFIVGWSLSNTMTIEWYKNCFLDAVSAFGQPDILNTGQGSQFTSPLFTGIFDGEKIKPSLAWMVV